MLQLVHFCTEI